MTSLREMIEYDLLRFLGESLGDLLGDLLGVLRRGSNIRSLSTNESLSVAIFMLLYIPFFSRSQSVSLSHSLYSRRMIIKCTKAHDTLAESGFDIKLCQSAGRSLRGDRPARATTVLYLIYELAGGFLVQLPRIGTIDVWVLLTTAVCLLRLSRLPLLSMTRIRQSNVCVRYYWSDR